MPAKAEEITIPADVTPEKVPTHIVDYSCKSFYRSFLQNCGEKFANMILSDTFSLSDTDFLKSTLSKRNIAFYNFV